MLTFYSAHGSPGASTTALHLATHWAAAGREILLVETDPAGGSLSHNLGIQFTPGSASFVASGLPVQSNHLIDHAQDVLFENLHVMPAPASPTGARGIFDVFAGFSDDLRTISENEMAVIIDGGRITADTAASALTTEAAGVVVVCRNNSQLSSIEPLATALAEMTDGPTDGPRGFAVTVGKSPNSAEEWQESYGLTCFGSLEFVPDMATNLSAYLARTKRKSKKWRASLEQIGEGLYKYAHPPVSSRPRRAQPAEPAAAAGTDAGAEASEAVPAPAAGYEQAYYPPPTAGAQPEPAQSHYPPPTAGAQPEPGQSHYLPPTVGAQPEPGQSHYLPPTGWLTDPHGSGAPPGYGEPAPAEGLPGYGQPAPTAYAPADHPAHLYEHPSAYQPSPEAAEQPQYPPPGTYEQPAPASYQQPPPPGTHEPTGTHQQPAPPETHEQPTPHAFEQPQQFVHSYEQSTVQPDPPAQPAPQVQPPEAEPAPGPQLQPTGSFRDWAVKLHGSNAHDMTAHRDG